MIIAYNIWLINCRYTFTDFVHQSGRMTLWSLNIAIWLENKTSLNAWTVVDSHSSTSFSFHIKQLLSLQHKVEKPYERAYNRSSPKYDTIWHRYPYG